MAHASRVARACARRYRPPHAYPTSCTGYALVAERFDGRHGPRARARASRHRAHAGASRSQHRCRLRRAGARRDRRVARRTLRRSRSALHARPRAIAERSHAPRTRADVLRGTQVFALHAALARRTRRHTPAAHAGTKERRLAHAEEGRSLRCSLHARARAGQRSARGRRRSGAGRRRRARARLRPSRADRAGRWLPRRLSHPSRRSPARPTT